MKIEEALLEETLEASRPERRESNVNDSSGANI
jgi:hypothetical protein